MPQVPAIHRHLHRSRPRAPRPVHFLCLLTAVFILSALLPFSPSALAQSVRWEPAGGTLAKGQTTQLQLIFENCQPASNNVSLPKLTDIALQLDGSQSSRFTPGNAAATQTYSLGVSARPATDANATIPSFKIKTNKGQLTVPSASFAVDAADSSSQQVTVTFPDHLSITMPAASFATGSADITSRQFTTTIPGHVVGTAPAANFADGLTAGLPQQITSFSSTFSSPSVPGQAGIANQAALAQLAASQLAASQLAAPQLAAPQTVATPANAAPPSVRWEPAGGTLAKGQTTQLQLVFENCQPASTAHIPNVPGLDLRPNGSTSTSTRFTNGYGTQTSRAIGVTAKPAPDLDQRITIPAFDIITDNGEITVPAVSFDIGEATVPDKQGGHLTLDQAATSKLTAPDTVYAGEVFPLAYTLTASKRFLNALGGNPDWDPAPLATEGLPEKPQITDTLNNGEPWMNIAYNTRAIARAPGDITLNPASQVIKLNTPTTAGINAIFGFPPTEQYTITSSTPAITVKPLPANAPASFAGAVGSFTLESKIIPASAADTSFPTTASSPTTVSSADTATTSSAADTTTSSSADTAADTSTITATVGEPITWTLTLTGTGNWPDITALPPRSIPQDFHTVHPRAKRTPAKEGSLFESTLTEDIVLIPTQPGACTLPAIEWTYFDTQHERYATITTPAATITITQEPPAQLPGNARVSRAAPGVSPDASERRHPAREDLGETPKPARETHALPEPSPNTSNCISTPTRDLPASETPAREILIALDLSRSMNTPDVKPSRLERARLLATSLLEKLHENDERAGLIIFSGTAFLQCPLTTDYEYLREFLPQLTTTSATTTEVGANYRALLDTAINSFDTATAPDADTAAAADRCLILLSDGEATDNAADWLPLAGKLKTKNIRVIALGIGTEAGDFMPDGDGGLIKDERGAIVRSKLQSRPLRDLAEKTAGAYADASRWVDLAQPLHATAPNPAPNTAPAGTKNATGAPPRQTRDKTRAQGNDIMLVIDLSGSMLAEDYEDHGERRNRLQAIQPIIKTFVNDRPDDRIGLVVFADQACTLSPPTLDHDWLARQLDRLYVGLAGQQTAIGDAIGVALSRLEQNPRADAATQPRDATRRQAAAIILFTDGSNNRGILTPAQATAIAKDRRIPIYTIGAGSNGIAPYPVFDASGNKTGYTRIQSDLDETSLRAIARETGGHYYRARDHDTIKSALAAINRALEQQQQQSDDAPQPDADDAPSMAAPLQKLAEVRDTDTPAIIFQRMQARQSGTTQPLPEAENPKGKTW